ncbi:phosphoribosylglycinamide formyltransferase [Wenyingzhuangia marina]|uniref:Phosphoribosylglycinamide formyltransferase n=1 Tax=Wenyingzhuangia marina TaxID=1195760 RepID=A0A1M5SXK1_9FLAO|nr:phosphoribosylglycinamide formyltransferase [Wenyingzhuangia marina]GGF64574.1 phosphoribosylglycinamide formyltransferase [Wenyingzhuangia marina]SHH43259.1 formyltetrahydrofolate-dependent phosphoribosylglycinamide formyltransferase [Wenyingzhuangia marina]
MIKIAILASGSGSNAENIAQYFSTHKNVKITYILSNKKDAFVLERAKNLGIKSKVFSNKEMKEQVDLLNLLKVEADFIILAGFLLKVPENIIEAFPNRIINIHPALLPNYGGKGMYGMHVHRAVKENNEPETGITIHYVNENYDEGAIIFQAKTALTTDDTPETIADKIHLLEQEHFPRVIDEVINS